MQNTYLLSGLSGDEKFNLIYLLILLVFLASGFFARFRSSPKSFLKNILMWILIIFALVLLYSYRFELEGIKNRIIGELNPSMALNNEEGSIDFRISRDGHYHIAALINRRPIEFILDTGASDVVITRRDAKRIGIDVNNLEFTKIYNTANGKVYGAPIVLNNFKVGNLVLHNIRASVNDAHMDKSLLGMSFLEKLNGYEVRDGILKLWP